MRKFTILLLVLLIGCVGEGGEQLTIFGRLSQLVQLGSTEETIAYKLQSEDYFVTIRGEVLMNRPAELTIAVTDRQTGALRDDLTLAVELCQAVDREIFGLPSCNEYSGAKYRYQLPAVVTEDNAYRVTGFDWDRNGNWAGTLSITGGESAEILQFSAQVYPQRPASTNTFELVSISLPFIVIVLFLIGLRVSKREMIQPVFAGQKRG